MARSLRMTSPRGPSRWRTVFVSELMHHLRCDNEALMVQIRETVKELISYELISPVIYPEGMMTESEKIGLFLNSAPL